MPTLLAGDIGGTKTILRLSTTQQLSTGKLTPLFERQYRSADFPDLVPMVQQFLASAAQTLKPTATEFTVTITSACFAIAGPVVDNSSQLTNLNWELNGDRLTRELPVNRVSLLNDFAAIGYGVTALPDSDWVALQAAKPQPQKPIAVLGAGTGLGEAYLTWETKYYQVHASEGGHTEYAPRTERQIDLVRYLWHKHPRVSVERIVSGQGIVAIYQFLRDSQFAPEPPDVASAVKTWEHDRSVDAAAAISRAAQDMGDRLCTETLHMFVEAYGAEAGDVGLKFLPYGGLYIAGGIAPKLLTWLKDERFLHAFSDKGRLSPVLSTIPVRVVLNPKVGLLGASLYASRM